MTKGYLPSALASCRLPAFGLHDGATIQVCSDELAQMFGAGNSAEILGRDLFEFIVPEERDTSVQAIRSAAQSSYRSVGIKADGSIFPMDIVSMPVRQGRGEGRLFTVRDLSPIALIVDDEPPVARMTASLMRYAGYQTAVYTSPRDALADYEREVPSVVVSDIRMPEMDGLALIQEIRRIDPGVPVILVSGYSTEPVDEDPLTVFVRKPFVRQDLQRALSILPERAKASLK